MNVPSDRLAGFGGSQVQDEIRVNGSSASSLRASSTGPTTEGVIPTNIARSSSLKKINKVDLLVNNAANNEFDEALHRQQ